MALVSCKCRKGAIDPECPRHGVGTGGASLALRNTVALVAFVVVLFWAIASAKAEGGTRPTALVVCETFGDRYCAQALRVGYCESGLRTNARNGQYRGLFQMGRWERRTYGHGPDARSQARAAWRYFTASGRDWSPWECQWAA